MTGYQTIREKIKLFIDKHIIPAVKKKDLDYYKVVNGVSSELGVTQNMVLDVLKDFTNSRKLAEVRVLTIPSGQVQGFLQELHNEEKQTKKDLEELDQTEVQKEIKKIVPEINDTP